MNVRRKIETVIGQLTERFNIQKIKAKIRRKICSHTIAVFIEGSTIFDNISHEKKPTYCVRKQISVNYINIASGREKKFF
jgi:hypothetical protein